MSFEVRPQGGTVIRTDELPDGIHHLCVVLRDGEIHRLATAIREGAVPKVDIDLSIDERGLCMATEKEGEYGLRYYVVVLRDDERERVVSEICARLTKSETKPDD